MIFIKKKIEVVFCLLVKGLGFGEFVCGFCCWGRVFVVGICCSLYSDLVNEEFVIEIKNIRN